MVVESLEAARRRKARGPSGAPGPKGPSGGKRGGKPGGEPREESRPTLGRSLRGWGVLLGVALAMLAWDLVTPPKGVSVAGDAARGPAAEAGTPAD